MWALGPLLGQPPSDAHVAAQLGAVGAEVRVPELLHADEAPEHLGQALNSVWASFSLPGSGTHHALNHGGGSWYRR